LDFGYNFSTDGGATFPYRGTGQGIVTLNELFSEFTDTRFGIEIKETPPEAAQNLCTLIREFEYEDRVLVSSSGQENMDVFRDSCPSVATSATKSEVKRFYIFQFAGLTGFYSPPFDSLQVPEYDGGTHVLTGRFVGAAQRWNLPVIPWTINEPGDFERLIRDFDVDGINTNYPDRLVELLEDQ
jgi:glycerophosphoryl diester phosphodiesterase